MQTTKLTNILLSNASHEGRQDSILVLEDFFIVPYSENTTEPHH